MKKGLFLIRGESFREGGQFSRVIGSENFFSEQILASKSHKKLIDKLVSEGNIIHIALDTVSTRFDDELKKVYGDIQSCNFNFQHYISQFHGLQKALDNIEYLFKENDYDFLVILRYDLLLKDKFIELFNVNDEAVKFPFVCWYQDRKLASGLPRIADTFFYIPKQFLGLRKTFRVQVFKDAHDILDLWTKSYSNFNYSFYVNTYHDSNTLNDWNPLYKIIGRSECLKMQSDSNLRYPEDF